MTPGAEVIEVIDTGAARPAPVLPVPRHGAAPTSPVGATVAALAADPGARDPLRGAALPDLGTLSDLQLHALTGALLAEKHRRAARWLGLAS